MQLQTQVDAGDAVELLHRAVGCQSVFGHNAGVVEGRVESAELGDRPLDHGFYLSVVADVTSDGKGSMALADQLLGGFLHRFLFDVGKRHGSTRLRKRQRGRQTNAGTGPGDERNLVIEAGVVVHIRLWFDVISIHGTLSRRMRPNRRPRPYQGWLAGPTVNSLMVVSSGWSTANATTLAIRSGEIPYRSYTFCISSAVSLWLIVPSSSVLIAAG
jgi:hypothetical protein